MPFLGGVNVLPLKEGLDGKWEWGTERLLTDLTSLTALRVGYSASRLAKVSLIPPALK